MIKEKEKYDILSNLIQTSFGKSSVRGGTFNIKMNVQTDSLMKVTVRTLTSFGHDSVFRDMQPKWKSECLDILNQALKKAEEEYKEAAKTKKNDETPKTIKLKVKPETIEDDYTLMNFSVYTPKKDIVFFVTALVDIS